MISFLSPIAVWVGLFALIPILIHFLGRGRLKREDFPSLLLIHKQLVRSSRRHRLKNILLLILRVLLILCLAAALFHPILKTRGASAKLRSQSLFAIHNGAWSGLKNGPEDYLELQLKSARTADSLSQNQSTIFPTIPEQDGILKTHWRYGGYHSALNKIEDELGDFPEKYAHCFLPVFHWAEAGPAFERVDALAKSRPETKFHWLDYSSSISLFAFESVEFVPSDLKPALQLTVQLRMPPASSPYVLKLFNGPTAVGEHPLEPSAGGIREFSFQIPITRNADIEGKLSVEAQNGSGSAAQYFFTLANRGELKVLHCGSEVVSLPSLGKGNYKKKVYHFRSLENDSLLKNLGEFQVIYLSNASLKSDRIYRALYDYTREGGTLLLGLGRRSDISRLNRYLLIPAKMGQVEAIPPGQEAVSIRLAKRPDIPNLETLAATALTSKVKKIFPWKQKEHVTPVLETSAGPLLGKAKFGAGTIVLWTSDIDNLQWTSIGATSFIPVFHQYILNQSLDNSWRNRTLDSDSLLTLDSRAAGGRPVVLDPRGNLFTEVAEQYGAFHIGPFSQLGNYSVITHGDSTRFAVNLALLPEDPDSKEPPLKERNSADIIGPDELRPILKESFYPLWKLFILMGVFLLLIEILLLILLGRMLPGGSKK